jgi:benzylsuccinate CoA-transferase BbsF subunit
LDGIRILDLTMVYAGPTGSKVLADMGAEVIKIEAAQRSDVFTRSNVYPENEPKEENWNRGSFFHSLNAGKYGITLNLGSEKGREIFKQLVKISDVVMENFSPRVMDNWGLGYEALKEIKPDIIMVSMSGLGHTGPLKDYAMYVSGMEASAGLSYLTGHSPNDLPLTTTMAYGDWQLGMTGAAGLLVALYYRKQTGKGQYIDVAGREAMTSHLGEVIMDYIMNSRIQVRNGNRHPVMAPHGCYPCQGEDEWVTIAIETDEQWRSFCQAIGDPEWAKDEKFSDVLSRWKNQEELNKLVEGWTRQHDHYEVMHILQQAGVPAGAVLDVKEAHLDPHFIERGFFDVIEHHGGIGKRVISKQMLPVKFSGMESFTPRPAPFLGQDNEYVFCKLLGMSKEELSKLDEEGVTGKVPVFPRGRTLPAEMLEKEGTKFESDYNEQLSKKYGEDIGPVK